MAVRFPLLVSSSFALFRSHTLRFCFTRYFFVSRTVKQRHLRYDSYIVCMTSRDVTLIRNALTHFVDLRDVRVMLCVIFSLQERWPPTFFGIICSTQTSVFTMRLLAIFIDNSFSKIWLWIYTTKLSLDTDIYRNPLFWKLFWVGFIQNVCYIDDKHPSEQKYYKLQKKSIKIAFQSGVLENGSKSTFRLIFSVPLLDGAADFSTGSTKTY